MLEDLYKREMYGPEGARQIETMGRIAVSIANRWQLGWPERVKALMGARLYLVNLDAQTERELDVLADAGGLDHLTHHELMQLHGIDEAPPTCETQREGGIAFAKGGNAIYPFPAFVAYAEPLTEEQRANIDALRKRQEAFTW